MSLISATRRSAGNAAGTAREGRRPARKTAGATGESARAAGPPGAGGDGDDHLVTLGDTGGDLGVGAVRVAERHGRRHLLIPGHLVDDRLPVDGVDRGTRAGRSA